MWVTTRSEARQYGSLSDVNPSKIPPTPLKKGGYFPPFLRGVRGDHVLTEPYCEARDTTAIMSVEEKVKGKGK
jgi:hypothetical protein